MKKIALFTSTAYIAVGFAFATVTYAEIRAEVYPWADHIPALCVLVGCIASYVNAKGFALIAGAQEG